MYYGETAKASPKSNDIIEPNATESTVNAGPKARDGIMVDV